MWHLASRISASDPAGAATIHELSRTTVRRLLTASSVVWLLCALLFSTQWDGLRIGGLMASIITVGLIFGLAYSLLARNYLVAYGLWLGGMVLAIIAASWLMEDPLVLLLSSVLPLVTVITLSSWAVGGTLLGLSIVLWVATLGLVSPPLSVNTAWMILAAGVFNGVFGWAARSELLSVAQWSLAGFETARGALNHAREWQLELAQSRADLIQANQELTRLYNRLKVLEQIAEEARQAKAEFVANVSHELRTPLNMIIGFADVIARSPQANGGRSTNSLLTDIAAIRRNAEHLSTLINDVLDLSQVETGRMALHRSHVDLRSPIEEAVMAVKGFFDARGLYLDYEFVNDSAGDGLPAVYCDGTRIRQVVINLLGNAGRFTEHGGVRLKCQMLDHEVIISVADTGPGISIEDQARIFEPFQQADVSTRRQHGGSGLGLTISKQFVEMHGGRMWLESTPGVGTTIFFTLPVDSTTVPPMSGRTAGAVGDADRDDDSGVRQVAAPNVLRSINPVDPMGYRLRAHRSLAPHATLSERYVVVDQEGELPRLIERCLPGVEIEHVGDIASAVDATHRSPAQALVVNSPPDEPLPAHLIGDLPFGTPVISCWLPGGQAAAQRLGVVKYLVKPLTRDHLTRALQQLGPAIHTVLILDDEEDELHLFTRMIESDDRRYSILQVTNGPRALSMLRNRSPDVLLLDLVMPGMSGYEVLAAKAADPAIADIPVIIISSCDPAGDPIAGHTLTVTQGTGLSQRNLIACIHAIGEILAPLEAAKGGHVNDWAQRTRNCSSV